MFLAGVPVDDKLVPTIASKLLDVGIDDTAERLETAYDRETAVLALSIDARRVILDVLVDCEVVALRTSGHTSEAAAPATARRDR